MDKLRTIEILNGVVWKTTEFENIKKGDYFRLFDGDTQVFDEDGNYMFKATSEVYTDNGAIFTVDCVGVDPIKSELDIQEDV